jgi:hypothetical protein
VQGRVADIGQSAKCRPGITFVLNSTKGKRAIMAQPEKVGKTQRSRRILGLSATEISALGGLAGLMLCVLALGGAYVFYQSQKVPAPVAIVVTATPGGVPSSTAIAYPTMPPEWTSTPVPTLTAAPSSVPLSEIDLEPLLVQPGDLPAGYSASQIRDTVPDIFSKVPAAAKVVSQLFAKDGETSGSVTVLLYESKSDLNTAFSMIPVILGGDNEDQPAVGEHAIASNISKSAPGIRFDLVNLTFIRCRALVQTQLIGTSYEGDIVAYGKRLDKRLAAVVCQ